MIRIAWAMAAAAAAFVVGFLAGALSEANWNVEDYPWSR